MRELTARHGALLIFDEVMTGFRVALGGAQQRFGIKPDLTTLGKIIGGGLPMAAYGGRADIMQKIAPLGPVYQAGTLSGNPLAVAAGLAMLRYLIAHPEIYDTLEARAAQLTAWTPPGVTINRVGSMFTFFFSPDPVTDWESAKKCDTARFGKFFHFMLERGVYLAPSQFEAAFLSTAHSEEDIRAHGGCGARVLSQPSTRSNSTGAPALQPRRSRGRGSGWRRFRDSRSCPTITNKSPTVGLRVGERQAMNALRSRRAFQTGGS